MDEYCFQFTKAATTEAIDRQENLMSILAPHASIRNRNEDIEILRGVAIIFILVVHIRLLLIYPSSLYNGFLNLFQLSLGVDLFFVISGFVIANSLQHSLSGSSTSKYRQLLAFWLKRVFRLLPAAWLWLTVTVAIMFVITQNIEAADSFERSMIPIYAAMLNILNFYSAYCNANPGNDSICGIYYLHGQYWSLSLEEQFYFVFPFLLFFVNRKMFIASLVLLLAAQFFWYRPVTSFGFFFRTDALCWGILLSFFSNSKRYISIYPKVLDSKYVSSALSLILVILLPAVGAHVTGVFNMKIYGVGLAAVLCALLVWLASYDKRHFGRSIGFRKVMMYIGSRSYALYISHLTLFIAISLLWDAVFGKNATSEFNKGLINIVVLLIAFSMTFVLSEFTYRFVELRYRNKGRKLAAEYLNKG